MIKNIIIVFLGGGLGSVMRYTMTILITTFNYGTKFPFNTFLCNAIGSLLIGMVMGFLSKNNNADLYLWLVVGCLGGFTTFSAFSWETLSLLKQGNVMLSAMYIMLTVIVCLLCTLAGFWIS